MLTGLPPFQSQSEYLIFQKIQRLEYSFHEGFNENAKDLICKLLVIEPSDRIGAKDETPYLSIRSHPFFHGVGDFDTLYKATPPCGSLNTAAPQQDPCWTKQPNLEPGAGNLTRLMLEDGDDHGDSDDNVSLGTRAADELRLLHMSNSVS
jgi:serine/threonine protein kinase